MAKRFPVLYPMPANQGQYDDYLNYAKENIEEDDYFDKCWENILPLSQRVCKNHKIQGEKVPINDCIYCTRYEKNMIKKIINNLKSTGFLDSYKDGDKKSIVTLPTHSISYLNSEICFSELVLESLRYSLDKKDGDQYLIEAIFDILSKLPPSTGSYIKQSKLINLLDMENDPINGYDFNILSAGSRRSLREILKLLNYMDIVQTDGEGKYKLNVFNKYHKIRNILEKSFKLHIYEKTIDVLGPDNDLLDEAFISSLTKYYIYRHTRNIGRQRKLIKEIDKGLEKTHNNIFIDYKNEIGKVRRGESILNTAKNYRKKYIKKILDRCNVPKDEKDISNKIQRLPITTLKRLHSYDTYEGLIEGIKRLQKRFDKSILDDLQHCDGKFRFPKDYRFYSDWQKEAVERWMENDASIDHNAFTGIVSAVTGSGKTIMALLAIEEYYKKNPNSIVSIIVPTKVLMYQWASELSKVLGLSSHDIGLRGDGFKDSFKSDYKVIVSIVNSAIRNDYLKKDIEMVSTDIKHLLIADECHRYGGDEFQKVFSCRIDASLGLSATPPSNEEENIKTDNEQINPITDSIGVQFYHLNYSKARKMNLICDFKIKYIGLELTPQERMKYDIITKKISKLLEKIRLIYGHRIDTMRSPSLHHKLQTILNNDEHPDPSISNFFRATKERREIVNNSYQRMSCYASLIRNGLDQNKKIMIFHEKISQLEEVIRSEGRKKGKERDFREGEIKKELQDMLYSKKFKPVMYHSQQNPIWNNWGMYWFKANKANTMLSVKALIEGVDVPSADLGIVRVSSSSVRQRIQTIGRVLRKAKEKDAEIYVLFVKDSVDTNIFKAYDWEAELGQAAIEYYNWIENDKSLQKKDILELPITPDYEEYKPPIDVDVSDIKIGDLYPGRFAGELYHVNVKGQPYKRIRNGRLYIKNNKMNEAGKYIQTLKGGGKLIVTPQGNMLTRIKGKGTIFLGQVNMDELKDEIEQQRKTNQKKSIRNKTMTFEELLGLH